MSPIDDANMSSDKTISLKSIIDVYRVKEGNENSPIKHRVKASEFNTIDKLNFGNKFNEFTNCFVIQLL